MYIFCRTLMWILSLTALVSSVSSLVIMIRIISACRKNPELLSCGMRKVFLKPIIFMCVGAVSAFISITIFVSVLL